ncbi:MAG: signal recognition particle-docking protein FtsY, partial [Coriobacteriales bacterium]|nr:signal recognition particle-docking protein FtsY [Coriobacteriales bacterium]
VARKRFNGIVKVVLVIDGSMGQNALVQAQEFNSFLNLDGVIITKLDGTAKGGIVIAISNSLNLPIYYIGCGETVDSLEEFKAKEFAHSLFDTMEGR